MKDKIMDKKSESETEKMYNDWYACLLCNESYNSQFALDTHLETHVDDDNFHHSNINKISEPLPQSSIKPSKYFICKCLDNCKIQLPYNKHMLNDTGKELDHGQVCDEKFHPTDNVQTHLNSDNSLRTFTCSLCDETIIGEKNVYIHYLDAHSDSKSQNNQSDSSDSDIDFDPKLPSHKKTKLNAQNVGKESEPFGPLFAKELWKKTQKSTAYNTEEYQKFLETLILENKSTGKFNEAKFIGPLFWKNSLIKAGLIKEDICPMQFKSQLKLIECTSCKKCFARLPKSNEGNILPSKPPCHKCYMTTNQTLLLEHQFEDHRVLPPFICKECLFDSYTWYDYVQHMKNHLIYAEKCGECVYSDMNNKSTNDTLVLCQVCERFFESEDILKEHILIHFKN